MSEESSFEWLCSPVDDDPAWLASERRALDQLFSITCEELRHLRSRTPRAQARRDSPRSEALEHPGEA